MLAALVDVERAIDPLPHRSGVQRRLNEHGKQRMVAPAPSASFTISMKAYPPVGFTGSGFGMSAGGDLCRIASLVERSFALMCGGN